MKYFIDSIVIPVPKAKRAAYLRLARVASKVWIEHGALEYHECIADDVPRGKRTSFPRSVQLKSSETVWISWIVYRSRRHRDRVNAEVMKDARFAQMNPKTLPFDAKRMFYGGFVEVVSRRRVKQRAKH